MKADESVIQSVSSLRELLLHLGRSGGIARAYNQTDNPKLSLEATPTMGRDSLAVTRVVIHTLYYTTVGQVQGGKILKKTSEVCRLQEAQWIL